MWFGLQSGYAAIMVSATAAAIKYHWTFIPSGVYILLVHFIFYFSSALLSVYFYMIYRGSFARFVSHFFFFYFFVFVIFFYYIYLACSVPCSLRLNSCFEVNKYCIWKVSTIRARAPHRHFDEVIIFLFLFMHFLFSFFSFRFFFFIYFHLFGCSGVWASTSTTAVKHNRYFSRYSNKKRRSRR